MSDQITTITHTYPDGLPGAGPVEKLKLVENSKGMNIEVTAATVERAFEMYDKAAGLRTAHGK